MTDALAMEDGSSAYVNVLVCKEGNENEPKIKALVAALQSQQVKDFMDENYKGAVVSVVETPTDGYDASIDYDALNGETVSCAATPAPHCEVLEVCKDILAAKVRHQLLPASAVSGQLQRGEGHPSGDRRRHPRRAHGHLRRQAGQPGTHRGLSFTN